MYIIEFFLKKISQLYKRNEFDPLEENFQKEQSEYENCEHSFMPLDSTAEMLSCTRCGMLKNRKELKKKNFFAG